MFQINRPLFWLITAICIRVFVFLYQGTLPDTSGMSLWGRYSCDTSSYFNPVEHLLEKGSYYPDFRMPGYAFVYYLLRLLFSIELSCNIIVIAQVLLSGISVYYLALIAYYISKSRKAFNLVYFLSLFTFYSAVYDTYLLTESFCTSSGILAVYFLFKGLKQKSNVNFILSGLFFTWMIFLKPVYLGMFLIILCVLIIYTFISKKNKGFVSCSNLLWLIVPFILMDSVWVIRNYAVHREIRILTNPFFAPKEELQYPRALTVFLQSWGGIHSVWMPHGHNLWFEGEPEEDGKISFPGFLTSGSLTYDSLLSVRQKILTARDTTLSEEIRAQSDIASSEQLYRFTNYIKKEQPWRYYLYAPLQYLKMFYAVPGTYFLFLKPFQELKLFRKVFLVIIALMQYVIMFGGTLAALLYVLSFHSQKIMFVFPILMVLFTFFIFPLILRMPEARFMVPAFPFQLVCLVLFLNTIYGKR